MSNIQKAVETRAAHLYSLLNITLSLPYVLPGSLEN